MVNEWAVKHLTQMEVTLYPDYAVSVKESLLFYHGLEKALFQLRLRMWVPLKRHLYRIDTMIKQSGVAPFVVPTILLELKLASTIKYLLWNSVKVTEYCKVA